MRLPYLLTLTDFTRPVIRSIYQWVNLLCSGPNEGDRCIQDCLSVPWTPDALRSRYRLARDLLTGASRLVCPSEYVALRYREAFPDLEFMVIPHGIDFLTLASGCSSKHIEGGEMIFGFIGSIIVQKGVDTLLKAFMSVPDANIRLRLCGGFFGDPVYSRDVRRLALRDERIEYLGQVDHADIFKVISSLDVLCLPSRVPETFSLVLHEAWAAGVPAIVSELGAPGEIVSQGSFGRTIPVDDVQAWAGAIADLAADRNILRNWRKNLPLPLRVEEEGFSTILYTM